MDFQKAFAEWAEGSKVAFDDDRTATIGASEIGGCARQVGYKKSKTPEDPGHVDTGGFAARGNVMEDAALVPVVRKAIEAAGGTLLWAGQADQMRLVNAKHKVSSTPDGLAINMPFDCLVKYGVPDITNGKAKTGEVYVELKSIDPRVAAHKLPKDTHVDQVNLGMGLVRDSEFEDGVLYEPNYAIIVYMDASDYSTIHIHVVAFDQEGYAGQLARTKYIMDAAALGTKGVETLRPEGKIAGDSTCRYCAFSKRCLGYAASVPKAVTQMDTKAVKKVRRLAGSLKKAKDKAEYSELQSKKIEAELKEELMAAKTNFVDIGDVKLNWSTSDGQERFDTEEAKKVLTSLGIDLKTLIKKTKPSERLSVEFVKQLAS